MEVAGLTMIQRVHSTWRRRVIARWLVCESSEGKGIAIQDRWGKSPWLIRAARCDIGVLCIISASEMPGFFDISSVCMALKPNVGDALRYASEKQDTPKRHGYMLTCYVEMGL